jgi:hypothetical protein
MRNVLRAVCVIVMALGIWAMIDLSSGPSGLRGEGKGTMFLFCLGVTTVAFVVFRLCRVRKPKDASDERAPEDSK